MSCVVYRELSVEPSVCQTREHSVTIGTQNIVHKLCELREAPSANALIHIEMDLQHITMQRTKSGASDIGMESQLMLSTKNWTRLFGCHLLTDDMGIAVHPMHCVITMDGAVGHRAGSSE